MFKLRVGARKFVVAMTALSMSFILAAIGKLTAEFVNMAMAAVGAFTTGNILEHLKEVWKNK